MSNAYLLSHTAVDLVNKGDSIVARIENLSVDGDIHGNGTRDSLFAD